MLDTQVLTKDVYVTKLEDLKYAMQNSKKAIKIIAKIQDKIILYYPMLSYDKYESYLKACVYLFGRLKEEQKKWTNDIIEKGMPYFLSLF